MGAKMKLNVNGQGRDLEGADPEMPLLWALRDFFGLKGTKFGCGAALCGACTVHLDGTAVRSCSTPVSSVGDGKIVTIEAVDGKVGGVIPVPGVRNNVPPSGGLQNGPE